MRIYNDAFVKEKDKEKTIEIIARYAKVTPKSVRESFPAGLDPNQHISLEFLDELQTFFIKQNFLRTPIDVIRWLISSLQGKRRELGTYK